MDANGVRFWMLANDGDWSLLHEPGAASGTTYDQEDRVLRLASRREGESLPAGPIPNATLTVWRNTARAALLQVTDARDAHGMRAWWDSSTREVRATGAAGGSVAIVALPADWGDVTDLACGHDDVLYVAVGGAIVLHDLRDRWDPVVVRHTDLDAWHIAPDPAGGVWVLDRTHGSIWRVIGAPFPARPHAPMSPTTIRPCRENPDDPRPELITTLPAVTDQELAGIAVSPARHVAVLAWNDTTGVSRIIPLAAHGTPLSAVTLRDAHFAYALAWTAPTEAMSAYGVAVLLPALTGEALIYEPGAGDTAEAAGDFFPLRAHTGGRFVKGPTLPVHYPISTDDATHASAPLLPISAVTLARTGLVQCSTPLDSGSTRTVWHRLYLEACFPPGCGARVFLAATNSPVEPPEREDEEWHEHLFGDVAPSNPRHPPARAAWVKAASELPFHPGLRDHSASVELHGPGRAGLFTVLVQRPNRPARALRGRYLWVRLELSGDGRRSPEIAAVRAYGGRFSYVERYLPELYHEQELGADADRAFVPLERATTTPADFLERFLATFEGVLTPLEDRIANAYLLSDPRTVPAENLEWLSSWVGIALDPALPIERQRAVLASASELAQLHGTLPGLARWLDLTTGGAVRGGEVVIVEDFRLRRTMATILGVDFANEEDPMLGGLVDSGNSIVGDTLVLGNEYRRDFLALFSEDYVTSSGEDQAVDQLFERLAHRVTILVHEEVERQDLGFIRRVANVAAPAHVITRVVPARYPFMIGIASLIGVDTYLTAPQPRTPVIVNRSAIGARDFLLRTASLDPRLSGAPAPAGSRLVPAHT